MFDYILFFGLGLVAIASAAGLLLSKNAVYAALNLIVNFATVAIFYLVLGAPFIALVQITVYAGAIMVLFLFVIMLLGAERLGQGRGDPGGSPAMPWQRPLAIILGLILLFETGYLAVTRWGVLGMLNQVEPGFGDPQAVGLTLFNQYLLPFEVVSVLLLVGMIGVIVLNRRQERKG